MMNATVIRKIIIFMMMSIPHVSLFAQLTPFPGSLTIEGQIINSGSHVFSHPASIISPGNPSNPVSISNTANVTFQSATEVLLKNGFEAGGFAGNGQFLGKINQNLDMVLVTPDPAISIINGQVHVPKWEKLEIALKLPNEYQTAIDNFFAHYWSNQVNPTTDLNPYAFDSLEVRFDLIKPDGTTQLTRWAFFMRTGKFAGNNDYDEPVEDTSHELFEYPFRFRFAPDELSNGNAWTFSVTIRNPQGLTGFPLYTYSGFSFYCDSPLPDNHGFLKVASNNRALQFEDNSPFFAIGTNLADVRKWLAVGPDHYQEYRKKDHDLFCNAVESLAQAGGNYIRAWLYKYNFAPEWEHLGVYDAYYNSVNCCPDGTSDYGNRTGNRQWSCWLFDEFLEKCREEGVYLQLCLDPSMPMVAYQDFQWGDHTYVRNFVYLTGDPNPNGWFDGPYDAKEFFITDGVADRANEGVMYYWKRKYKYIFSRWGYSTNIASFETFNEIDQTLGYYTSTTSTISTVNAAKFQSPGNPSPTSSTCGNNIFTYTADPSVIATIEEFHDYILEYAQEELDDNKHLFNVSYTHYEDNSGSPLGYHSLFDHPRLDFNDVHNYDDDINAVSNRYANIQNTYTAATIPKPVILGESSTIGRKLMSDGITNIDTHNYYENNDISLHNEIWSSAMSGAMGTGLSWWWENIFWWELGMPNEFSHSNQTFQVFNGLGETNQITIDGALTSYTNSTSYHQYKPLSDFLQNVDLNQPFDSKIYTDAPNGIQAIYNIPQSGGYPGYGWVHNASNTWHTKWVMDEFNNYFEDNTLCSSSATDIFTISGLIPNKTYSVTFFPTRMAGQILPNDFNGTAVSCGGTGCLTVDMDFMLGCDTTDSDFAFIVTCISCTPQQRLADSNPSGFNISPNASYEAFPNPSGKHVMLSCPLTEHYTCVIIDNHGKQVREFEFTGDRYLFNHSILLPGFYLLRIQSKAGVICKKLVIE